MDEPELLSLLPGPRALMEKPTLRLLTQQEQSIKEAQLNVSSPTSSTSILVILQDVDQT